MGDKNMILINVSRDDFGNPHTFIWYLYLIWLSKKMRSKKIKNAKNPFLPD